MSKALQTFLQENGTFRYQVEVPDFIADREGHDHWEKDRLLSMEANLKMGDILLDVGAELGWQSAIYAKFVGAENMCLFEPAAELWPTIRAIWEMNGLANPKYNCFGLASNRSFGKVEVATGGGWPGAASLAPLTGYDNWAAIHSFVVEGGLGEISLDDFCENLAVRPAAITIDIEGAEHRALLGARRLLAEQRPLVWVSLHPDARLAKYRTSKKQIREMVRALGYLEQYLGVDHEEHFFFYPAERKVALVDSPWRTYGKRNLSFEEAIPEWKDPWLADAATWGAD